jgi:hypothetical protein
MTDHVSQLRPDPLLDDLVAREIGPEPGLELGRGPGGPVLEVSRGAGEPVSEFARYPRTLVACHGAATSAAVRVEQVHHSRT